MLLHKIIHITLVFDIIRLTHFTEQLYTKRANIFKYTTLFTKAYNIIFNCLNQLLMILYLL